MPVIPDVRLVGADTFRRVDVIAGGFPCKGASTAGKRNGFEHPETVLWREMARAIRELRPRYVLVENVAHILALHDGAVWGEVVGKLATLGFSVEWDCLPAAAFGASHLRDRVVAIAVEAERRLWLAPRSLREANAYVARHHRHSGEVRGCKFALGAAVDDELVGVALAGRPVARMLQDGWTLEVLRVCTTGTRNACSFLYGGCWRAARALGYRRLVTYTLASELGASPRAAGFAIVGEVKAESWDRPSRPRDPGNPQERFRWEICARA